MIFSQLIPNLKSPRKRAVFLGLILMDVCIIGFSYYLSLYISFGCDLALIPHECFAQFSSLLPAYIGFCLLLYLCTRMYNGIWRFVSYHEIFVYTLTVVSAVFAYYLFSSLTQPPFLPRRYYVIGCWIQLWLVLLLRFSYRFLCFFLNEFNSCAFSGKRSRRKGMLIGAGAAGSLVLRDILDNPGSRISIKCIIDDNRSKKGCRLCGVPIAGGRQDILKNVKKYGIEEILFAIPSAPPEDKREILNICNESGCKLRVLPSVGSLVSGEVTLAKMRDVTIEELLVRKPIEVKNDGVFAQLSGKVIMVTGGGGSIGSELCRQIAGHSPKQLVIFDIYENNAYNIQQELRRTFPALDLVVLIGSVRDTSRVSGIFRKYRPEIVFHAAAHKHVPLMEDSPCEAIKNNVLGTYKTACAAMFSGCRRFVLISTDKAVNPTNIMGASKRLCEMIVQSLDKISRSGEFSLLARSLSCHRNELNGWFDEKPEIVPYPTEFVAVRFGNVLGSNGSVIPLFKEQIAAGGPVTVTHPDIVRYFMTIPEAVSLVLEAANYAKGGEIFVLDMGEPVKIDALARSLIKLSGFTPGVDIKIEYTGLRPGEKLYEEKLMSEEGLQMTPNSLIHVAKPLDWDLDGFFREMEKLAAAAYSDDEAIGAVVREMVKTYHAPEA